MPPRTLIREETSMDVVAISTNLLFVYGTMVLTAGTVVGLIIGRVLRSRSPLPSPDTLEHLQRRIERLELETDTTNALLIQVLNETGSARVLPPSSVRIRAA